jgi:pectin methylesterase-like acyl-CoA thioesterase
MKQNQLEYFSFGMQNSYNLQEAARDFYNGEMAAGDVKRALAARIYGDKSSFFECGFMGFQDTLWDVSGRHYFKNCYIEGGVDFIWGNGQSIYEVISGQLFIKLLNTKYISFSFY